MQCSVCEKKAVIKCEDYLCSEHFCEHFESTVKNTIAENKLFTKKSKILVGVSGGKDSLTILYLLKKFGYTPDALIIDEGIPGYREKSIEDFKTFCAKHGEVPYRVVSFKEEYGNRLVDVIDKTPGKPCSVCGVQRRQMLNKYAEGYDVLVTGHNLDDELQAFMMNLLKANTSLAARHGPRSGIVQLKGFVPRVKPLYFCSEKEVKLYSFINKLTASFTECPHCPVSFRHAIGTELNKLEARTPGTKRAMLNNYLKLLPQLKHYYREHNDMRTISQTEHRMHTQRTA